MGLKMSDRVEDSDPDCFRVETDRAIPVGTGLGNCCPDQCRQNFETWISTVAGIFYVCPDCGHSFWFDYGRKVWEDES